MNRSSQANLAMMAGIMAMGIDPTMIETVVGNGEPEQKKHWKETQSDEARDHALTKAKAKRERKQKLKDNR